MEVPLKQNPEAYGNCLKVSEERDPMDWLAENSCYTVVLRTIS